MRGDGPLEVRELGRQVAAPPHARGWTPHLGRRRQHAEGSPACAGMDPWQWAHRRRPDWLPRMRGDGPRWCPGCETACGAPPHARGWTQCRKLPAMWHLGSPACAGMDPCSRVRASSSTWLPRMRGDGPVIVASSSRPIWAPPHARGWTLIRVTKPGRLLGSPACAGMDLAQGIAGGRAGGLPRMRGDGPLTERGEIERI